MTQLKTSSASITESHWESATAPDVMGASAMTAQNNTATALVTGNCKL